jgi:hypothetical protein
MEEMKAKRIVVGPHAFLEKPIVPSEYVKRIRQHLEMAEVEATPGDEKDELKDRVMERLSGASREELEAILKVLKGKGP